ncbi:MAG: hydroxymethylpyrimidine/phosphomethylpyrimidine kinase [Polaromonas sp. 39-63-203]|jgi:hydroxymethylpyrimidine/phosphomethylpyrimidine kinase|uniref:bifunctional hydroxymethylpyrimidine kinase/phosphomethylpyrimidine kinase n=1 Tax=Polaromonas sp. TaxID=1869339 RepID=UPI000BCF7FCC|nr:bifunctional hydroxymethylpyrimidine kinase/phosphomethylpyrimidine kinase [Polaromonas sp.]OYY51065.1 MAG: hydroxymethylpyrimidine/phosphomethylpyrimidine kinase [Polaromonas sp. 35-63-240]OYZ81756.1 MAG: hydroxymethylpyrimidine/phosphomethylpyrimidine kinase [Polaromonas sp. 24-62-144]OZA95591.1 MAG: hydroxymethylpyrimidine/phosphomethylpyrimidine kinase [Polaromonas sp. 39-63-203]HQS30750.1 bifunctional hydroxymethylpyrimidine kinase/phosphomethylpyrimidine kinase [Polaromonas sp.]HQS899
MPNPNLPHLESRQLQIEEDAASPACVMTFNANDASGAGGLTADIAAIASAGAHALAVVTGAYVRDTAEILDHFAFDEEAVTDQARAALEDMPVAAIKVGFVGSPENISTIAQIASDYSDIPLIAYMPNLSWWDESEIDSYLDAFRELLLPQTTLLVGNHSSLWRWLLPDWPGERNPSARDIAKAAADLGVPYTLVTGIPLPDQFIDNVLATPQAVLYSEKFERFEAVFSGAGDTLCAALAALLANGHDLQAATAEALTYLDHSLDAGFHPGMGNIVPDRMFWAQTDVDADDAEPDEQAEGGDDASPPLFDLPSNGTTKH